MAHVAADFAVPKKTSVLDVQMCLVENRCMLNTRRKGLDFMKDTLNMPPHERIKLLRKGEQVLCKKCRKGIMRPVGDYEKTNTFSCDYCKSQLIID